jgi:hypothetical protein
MAILLESQKAAEGPPFWAKKRSRDLVFDDAYGAFILLIGHCLFPFHFAVHIILTNASFAGELPSM